MTRLPESATCAACPARRSTLPFDVADMLAVRLLPSQFARVVGVSKQSVSKWIRAGKVTLGPDGRLDPVCAIQEVLRNTAPTKLRARIFRQAMQGAEDQSIRIRALERTIKELELALKDAPAPYLADLKRLNRALVVAGDQERAAVAAERARAGMHLLRFKQLIGCNFARLQREFSDPTLSLRHELDALDQQASESLRPRHIPSGDTQ